MTWLRRIAPLGAWVECNVALLLVVVCISASASAQSLDRLHVEVFQPLSPFESVTYEFKPVGGSRAVAITRVHAGGYGTESQIEVISASSYHALFESLGACEAGGDEAADPVPPGVAWAELSWTVDSQPRRLSLSAEAVDRSACLIAIREAALRWVRPPAYTVPFWDEGEYGMLRATASVAARVYVDGADTGLITPIHAFRLEPGLRSVRWVSLVGGVEQTREVRVNEGMTTTVHVSF